MPFSVSTLAQGLEDVGVVDNVADAVDGFVSAWEDYFLESTPPPGTITTGLTSMRGAMLATYNLPGQGPSAIQAGIVAFWSALSAAPSAVYTGATVITPPAGLSGLSATLLTVGTANVTQENNAQTSTTNIATAINTANALGSFTLPGPPPVTTVIA